MAPPNSCRTLTHIRLRPASIRRKPANTTTSTPKMISAFRNCFQPRLNCLKVFIDTTPAHRNMKKSSTPLPEKIRSGSRETRYTGRTTRLGKKACRYRTVIVNGMTYTIDGAIRSTRKETTAVRVKTVSR